MPAYPFFCPEHGEIDIYRNHDKASEPATCPECDAPMKRIWTPVPTVVDFTPGWQPAFGKWVDTKKERDNLVAEKGLTRG